MTKLLKFADYATISLLFLLALASTVGNAILGRYELACTYGVALCTGMALARWHFLRNYDLVEFEGVELVDDDSEEV